MPVNVINSLKQAKERLMKKRENEVPSHSCKTHCITVARLIAEREKTSGKLAKIISLCMRPFVMELQPLP